MPSPYPRVGKGASFVCEFFTGIFAAAYISSLAFTGRHGRLPIRRHYPSRKAGGYKKNIIALPEKYLPLDICHYSKKERVRTLKMEGLLHCCLTTYGALRQSTSQSIRLIL
jgi:hypothetical protein